MGGSRDRDLCQRVSGSWGRRNQGASPAWSLQAPDPGKIPIILAFFLLRRLSPGLFVTALPLGINRGKTFTQYRLQFPLVYKVRRKMKGMIAKSPASDNIL